MEKEGGRGKVVVKGGVRVGVGVGVGEEGWGVGTAVVEHFVPGKGRVAVLRVNVSRAENDKVTRPNSDKMLFLGGQVSPF